MSPPAVFRGFAGERVLIPARELGSTVLRLKLREKTLLITMATLFLFILAMYSAIYGLMLQNATAQEDRGMLRFIREAQERVAQEAEDITEKAGDWSAWDDTYRYMEDRNPQYVKSNMQYTTFVVTKLSVIAFYDTNGSYVFGRAFDLDWNLPVEVPMELVHETRFRPDSVGSGIDGFLVLNDTPVIIAAKPVLTSSGEGPARGVLIMGREFGATQVAMLSGASGIPAGFYLAGKGMPADVSDAEEAIVSGQDQTVVKALGEDRLAGYFAATDLDGRHIGVFRMESRRQDYEEFRSNSLYLLIGFVVVGLFYIVSTFYLLDAFVLRRLRRLGEQAEQVGREGGGKEAVGPDIGDDEISQLTQEINRMLQRLAQVRHQLLRSQISYGRRLSREVQHKTKMLEAANERLQHMEKTKNQFLFNIGHELKSPLAVIEMNVELAGNDRPGGRQWNGSFRMIKRNIVVLKQKIEEIIQLSRFEHGHDVEKADLDLAGLVRQVAHIYDDFAKVHKVKIHLKGAEGKATIVGDRRLLQYALGNLFSNAVKYCDGRDISAGLERTDGHVVFSIENSGESIRPENRKKLFMKFFKEDPNSPGTGVGLFITREIVKGHGGRVWYEPGKIRGSIFRISLPVKRGE